MTSETATNPSKTLQQGIWSNNPALVQLLGLCPLLAVSNSATNGLSLGVATVLTLVISNICVSATRKWLLYEIRIPIFVLLIAGIVTMIGMVMNAWSHELYLELGIFIPLIITNCVILARAESFASKNPVIPAAADGLTMGCGFALVLLMLGAIREFIGTGYIFAESHLLFGEAARSLQVHISNDYRGLLVAILPPGAFILLGLLIAIKNAMQQAAEIRPTATASTETLKP